MFIFIAKFGFSCHWSLSPGAARSQPWRGINSCSFVHIGVAKSKMYFKKNQKFWRGGGFKTWKPSVVGYGYFLELPNTQELGQAGFQLTCSQSSPGSATKKLQYSLLILPATQARAGDGLLLVFSQNTEDNIIIWMVCKCHSRIQ